MGTEINDSGHHVSGKSRGASIIGQITYTTTGHKLSADQRVDELVFVVCRFPINHLCKFKGKMTVMNLMIEVQQGGKIRDTRWECRDAVSEGRTQST